MKRKSFMEEIKLYYEVYDSPYWDELYLGFINQFENEPYLSDAASFIFQLVCKLENKKCS